MRAFSHRGLATKSIKENTIESLKNAINSGFEAIEFDIWYVDKSLILNHDQPKKDINEFDNLDKFLGAFANKIDYWLDFKNLNPANAHEALKKLKKITDKLKISNDNLYFAPFITNIEDAKLIFEVIREYFGETAQILAVKEVILEENYETYHEKLKDNNISHLSIEHHNINSNFMRVFFDIEIFAWTIDDFEEVTHLNQLGVQNITTDLNLNEA